MILKNLRSECPTLITFLTFLKLITCAGRVPARRTPDATA
jgi:hypothetical protein